MTTRQGNCRGNYVFKKSGTKAFADMQLREQSNVYEGITSCRGKKMFGAYRNLDFKRTHINVRSCLFKNHGILIIFYWLDQALAIMSEHQCM